jgi:hypothetical protein
VITKIRADLAETAITPIWQINFAKSSTNFNVQQFCENTLLFKKTFEIHETKSNKAANTLVWLSGVAR